MAMSPHISTLALARLLLGVGTALMSATGLAYMSQLWMSQPLSGVSPGLQSSRAASWVAASTSLGFGLGPFVTTLTLYLAATPNTLVPPSYVIHMAAVLLAGLLLWRVSGRMAAPGKPLPSSPATRMLRLPAYPPGSIWFGLAIALAWATTGIIISVLPAVLALHGLAKWSGATTLLAVSCGLLFQPAARRCQPQRAVTIGLLTLLPAFVILAFGALRGQLLLVLLGALMASSACYGFVYLGGLAGVAALADEGNNKVSKASVSAGFFMLAYVGYSLPVVFTGALADAYGKAAAMTAFGSFLVLGVAALLWWRRPAAVLNKAVV
jgi:MFS family permease